MVRRPELLGSTLRHLLHVVRGCNISGTTAFMLELVAALPDYGHTVVVIGDPWDAEPTLILAIQSTGATLLFCDRLDHTALINRHNAAILYSVRADDVHIGEYLPKIYYAYGQYDPLVSHDVLLFPSRFAASKAGAEDDYDILPPGIRSRMMRGAAKRNKATPFTFGVLSSHTDDRYPKMLVDYLMMRVPKDMRMLVTHHPDLEPPKNNTVWMVPPMVDATIKGIQLSDVTVYARSDNYETPFGRTCVESMAARTPVICQRRGAPVEALTDNKHVLMFDDPDEVLDKLKYLRDNTAVLDKLAATGQVWASWQDLSTQVGKLKGILQSVGA